MTTKKNSPSSTEKPARTMEVKASDVDDVPADNVVDAGKDADQAPEIRAQVDGQEALEYRPEAGEKPAKEGAAQVANDPSPDDQPAGEK